MNSRTSCINCQERLGFLNSFFAKLSFLIDSSKYVVPQDSARTAQVKSFCRLTERALGLFKEKISEDIQASEGSVSVCL